MSTWFEKCFVCKPRVVWGVVPLGLASLSVHAAEFTAGNASEVTTALQQAGPGDTVVLTDGVWTNQYIRFNADGTAGNPITLRAETPGGVVLNGSSRLDISGDHLVVDGLHFNGGSLSSGHVVRFTGSNGDANHSRFTNSAITDYNPADIDTRYFWVSMYGTNNRVDHNTFTNQNHSGVTVTVWRDSSARDDHRIDANHFNGRPEGNGNGFETIRIGTSQQSLSDSYTVVENNLFEEVDGEIEAISVKAGQNDIRFNTFRRTSATVTLRHGNDNTVEGNFFLGENVSGSGGVRIIGERQTIVNNYLQDLDGRANGGLVLTGGVPNSPNSGYFQVKDAVIAHNTIVNITDAGIILDEGIGSSGRTLLPEGVTIANNLIQNAAPAFEGNEGASFTWEGNIVFGGVNQPTPPGVTVVDPQLVQGADGLFRPAAGSPVIDGAAGDYGALVPTDFDGQARVGLFDVGADEVSSAQIVRKPLSEGDVGAGWFYDPGTGPGPGAGLITGPGHVALTADSFSNRLDPNGDGDTWVLASAAGSLGQNVLEAPPGDRVDPPLETQDAVATFGLTFTEAGTYTAYYRAAGFSSSTDSFHRPVLFGDDPETATATTNTGAWDWENGGTFVINDSMLGMPLELRLGKREQFAVLDAIVFALDGSLTDAELDALFTATAITGDYNGNGQVEQGDLDLVLQNWGTGTFGGDAAALDGGGPFDGNVDQNELDGVLQNWGASSAPRFDGASLPEPGSVALLGFVGLGRRRG